MMTPIYLVNPISGRGHLDAYARLYARTLLDIGHDVVLIAPNDGETVAYLKRTMPEVSSRFHFFSSDALDAEIAMRTPNERAALWGFSRARLVFAEEGFSGILDRVKQYGIRFVARHFPRVALSLRLVEKGNARISFEPYPARIELVAERTGLTNGIVVFLYLDMMSEDRRSLDALEQWAWAWGGILFHPKYLGTDRASGPEAYLRTSSARGALFLIPQAQDAYSSVLGRLSFSTVPDIADLERADFPPSLVQTLRAKAGGRKIVLQIGTLTLHKGMLDLISAVSKADPERFFFAFVGKIYDETFGKDATRVREFFEEPPENIFLHDDFIDDERDYNAVIAAADIAFAVYRDFPNSSNILTKAAAFSVPLLVSDRYLMGQSVREYDMGIAVPEGDSNAIVAALEQLAERVPGAGNFESYAFDRSLPRLKTVLDDAIKTWQRW